MNNKQFYMFAVVTIVGLGATLAIGAWLQRWEPLGGLTVLILTGTIIVNTYQVKELQRQRTSSQQPLLVPQGFSTMIVRIFKNEGLVVGAKANEEVMLRVKNVGAGPASNIKAEIQQRLAARPPQTIGSPLASIPPLGCGDERFIYHLGDENLFMVNNDDWLVMSYEDIFGTRYETECQWSGVTWHNFKTKRLLK